MGIPKFYRWLSERYPLINQPGGATVVPIIDNFYLDMNGIIHNCTHGNNHDVKLTEDEMIVRIFTYLDKLFHIVKPQKLMFMAIDGVAPRAKMNQQRARRFKAAKEAEEAADAAARKGEPLPDADSRFDSNCITPGTPFMARLGAHLRFFIRKKIAEDPAWRTPAIVFSGHDIPGEGEHKIMEYIRWAKRDPAYAPNTRHCLYGLDADLIMLSLVTHEPHFNLLREVVSYTGGNRGQPAREVLENPCQEHFVLLQIGLLRDYFDLEFKPLAPTLPFAYDLERIIDDFILFGMLVGNDFLPALPTCDISEGSLDFMFDTYRRLLPSLGGYLTYAGDLHRGRLERFLKELASQEADVLEARATDAEEYEAKQSRRGGGRGGGQPAWASAKPTLIPASVAAAAAGGELDDDDAFAVQMATMALAAKEGHELELLAAVEGELDLSAIPDAAAAPSATPAGPTMMSKEARAMFLDGDKAGALSAWRSRYYREKLHLASEDERRSVVDAYLQGLHWVLEYYYRGVASWNWFYPFHYAPMASDCTNLTSITVTFTQGTPFAPYEQLLAVQPSSSCRLLPEPYRWLMTDPKSPIADFYPVEFAVDMEGKRADWEAIVLIPFIDEERLLAGSKSVPQAVLSPEERARNAMGKIMVFGYDENSTEDSFCASTLPAHYSSVMRSYSTALEQAAPPPLPMGEKGFVPAFVSGTRVGATGPAGFPTLRTLSVTGHLRRAGVNVFGMTSKRESVILTLKDQLAGAPPSAQQVAAAVVGQRAWVKWPYLQESVVEAVTDGKVRAGRDGSVRQLTSSEADEWHNEAASLSNDHLAKHGLDLGEVHLLLHVRPCEGLVRALDGSVEKRFAKAETAFPLQVTLRRNPAPDPRFQADAAQGGAAAAAPLPEGAKALFLGRAHYGCVAEVTSSGAKGLSRKGEALSGSTETAGSTAAAAAGPYRVMLSPSPANSAQVASASKRILSTVNVQYQPSGQVARKLGVSGRTLGRITGNVWVQLGEERRDRADIGLCVKNGAKGLCVPDYCAPMQYNNQYTNQQQQGGPSEAPKVGWAYSDAMVRVLQQYKQRYAWVWAALENDSSGAPELSLEQLLPGLDKDAAVTQVGALRKWLKSQPLSRRPLVPSSARIAPESAVRMLQASLPPRPRDNANASLEMENVAPALLLPPLERGGLAAAFAGGSFELADRVVAAGSSGTPPFGSRGTVIGVLDDAIEVLFDQEFLGGTDLFGRCTGNCGALLLPSDLLNLSRPHAVKAEGAGAPKVISRQSQLQPAGGAVAVNGGGGGTTTPSSAASALAAASAGLQEKDKKKQPTIPDKSGAKGFSMGRGRGLPPPPPPHMMMMMMPPPPPMAPGAGMHLLAHLQGKAPPPMPMPMPMHMPPMPMHVHMPMPPPPPHYMMPPPPGPPPGMQQGSALLAQLQGKPPASPEAAAAAPAPAPGPPKSPSNAGSALLSQLQASSQQQVASPAAQPPPSGGSGGGGNELDSMWNKMQAEHSGPPQTAVPSGGHEDGAPPPPAPSAALLGGGSPAATPSNGPSKNGPAAPSGDATAFWNLLSNANNAGAKKK